MGREFQKYVSKMDDMFPVLLRNFPYPHSSRLSGFNITPPQYFALATLTKKRKCLVGELSKALGVSVNSVSELVSRLVKKHFVKKERDEKDRRRVFVHLTQLGERIIHKLENCRRKHIKALLENLTEDDCRDFFRILEKITDAHQNRVSPGETRYFFPK